MIRASTSFCWRVGHSERAPTDTVQEHKMMPHTKRMHVLQNTVHINQLGAKAYMRHKWKGGFAQQIISATSTYIYAMHPRMPSTHRMNESKTQLFSEVVWLVWWCWPLRGDGREDTKKTKNTRNWFNCICLNEPHHSQTPMVILRMNVFVCAFIFTNKILCHIHERYCRLGQNCLYHKFVIHCKPASFCCIFYRIMQTIQPQYSTEWIPICVAIVEYVCAIAVF